MLAGTEVTNGERETVLLNLWKRQIPEMTVERKKAFEKCFMLSERIQA